MKILVVEDDPIIAGFIAKGFRESAYTVETASDGTVGLNMALHNQYDAGIIDIMLPNLDGLGLIERLRACRNNTPVIILSAKRSVDDRINGLRNGGDDYLTKPFSFSELLARVQALVRRANRVPEATTLSIDDLEIDLLSRTAIRAGQSIDLQPREFALLEYLMRNTGRVVSKTMICERVWNYNFNSNTNVVEARISKLRDKIDRPFSTPLIHTIRGLGYVIKAGGHADV